MDSTIKIGAVAPSEIDGAEYKRRIRLMDEVGFDSLWLYETTFTEESFSRAGFMAATTKQAKIGLGVINPYTRHPGLTAMGVATLDRLSNERLILLMGTGSGGWIRGLFGHEQRKPISDLLDSMEVIRRMLAGQKVTFEASGFRIRNAELESKPVRSSIPIYVAESERNDKVILKTSQVADGFYLGHGNRPLEFIRRDCELVSKLNAGSRAIELGAHFPFRITSDRTKELHEIKPWLAFYLSEPVEGERLLEFGGFETEILVPIRKALKTQELISQGKNVFDAFKVGNMAEAIRHVPDELADACSVIGTPGECREKLGELEKAGLTFVALSFQAVFDLTVPRIKEVLFSE